MPQALKHLCIVIPVYNEGKVIKKLISSLPKTLPGIRKISILVVDDGSFDESIQEVSKTRAKLIRHPINMGVGSATVTGLKAAQMIGADLAVTLDGDGQHDPRDIKNLIRPIIKDEADLVVGTRLQKRAKGMPLAKRFGNWGLNLITYALSRMWTTDSQSGFKCFSRLAIDRMDIESLGYEFCSEVIIEAKRHGLRLKEAPIKVIYSDYSKKKGQSMWNGTNIVIKLIISKITRA